MYLTILGKNLVPLLWIKVLGEGENKYWFSHLVFHQEDVVSAIEFSDFTSYKVRLYDGNIVVIDLEKGIEPECMHESGAYAPTPPRRKPLFGRIHVDTIPQQEETDIKGKGKAND